MTKSDYIEAILEAMHEYSNELIANLIVSIDRRHSIEQNMESVRLAVKFKDRGVVGVDLCGDPYQGTWEELKIPLMEAKRSGLKVTVHLAEITGSEPESIAILKSQIADRVGHATFLNEEIKKLLLVQQIPVEICLTSNVICKTVSNYADHHFAELQGKVPCVLCTDDQGIFGADLVDEYRYASEHFKMDEKQLLLFARQGIDCIFANDATKLELQRKMDDFAKY